MGCDIVVLECFFLAICHCKSKTEANLHFRVWTLYQIHNGGGRKNKAKRVKFVVNGRKRYDPDGTRTHNLSITSV